MDEFELWRRRNLQYDALVRELVRVFGYESWQVESFRTLVERPEPPKSQ